MDGITSLVRANFVSVLIGGLGCVFLIFGAFQLANHFNSSSDVTFEEPTSGPQTKEKIAIDVEGAILKPGVYQVDSDSRIVDVLAAAGGMSEEADRDYVQKSINLAQKVSDGIKIYIPRVGEKVLSVSANSTLGSSSTVNVNTASQSDLDKLPGIGPVTAGKIIDGRPYGSADELLSRKIVTQSVFDKIKDQISAN